VIIREMIHTGKERLPGVLGFTLFGSYIAVAAFVTASSPVIGMALFCLPLLLLLTFYRTDVIFILFFLVLPFDKLGKIFPADTAYLGTLTIAKVFLLVVILAFVAKVLIFKADRSIQVGASNPLTLILVGFVLVSVLSLANAENRVASVFYLLQRFNLLVLFVVSINIIRDEHLLHRILLATLIGYVGVALVGIYEFATGEGVLISIWGEGVGQAKELANIIHQKGVRIRGFTGDPDFHGVSMVLPTMIALMMTMSGRSRISKVTMMVLCGLFVFNILATGSRGAALSVISATLVFFLFSRFPRKFLMTGLILAILGGFYVFSRMEATPLPMERFVGESGLSSIQYRVGWAQMAFEMIRDHPFIGVGTGNFPFAYHRYLNPRVPPDPMWTHNSFLQVWAENGFLAFLLYVCSYVLAGRNFLLVYRRTPNEAFKVRVLALFATLCGYVLFACTSNAVGNEYYWILFAFSLAALVIENRMQTGEGQRRIAIRVN